MEAEGVLTFGIVSDGLYPMGGDGNIEGIKGSSEGSKGSGKFSCSGFFPFLAAGSFVDVLRLAGKVA